MRKDGLLAILLVICLLVIYGCGRSNGSDDETRYYKRVLSAGDSVICIKSQNSASIVDLDSGEENNIRGAKYLRYDDAVFCDHDGRIYFETGNVLYSVNTDGSGLKKVWKKGTSKSYELSIKGAYDRYILFALVYTSETLGIYDGEYIIYDAETGKIHSINGNSIENAFSYLITSSDDGKVFMAVLSGTDYHLVSVDIVNEEITDLGWIDTSMNPGTYPDWTGCITDRTLYFTDWGSSTGYIYTMKLNGGPIESISVKDIFIDIEPRFGNRIHISSMDSDKDKVYFLLNEFTDRDFESVLFCWDPDDNSVTMVDDCSHKKELLGMMVTNDQYYIYSDRELVSGVIK